MSINLAKPSVHHYEASTCSPALTIKETKKDGSDPFIDSKSPSEPTLRFDVCRGEDDLSSILRARSPVRNVQKGGNIIESGQKFGFIGNQGGIILQGVGERLKVNQGAAKQNLYKLEQEVGANEMRAQAQIWEHIKRHMKYPAAQ